MDLLNNDTYWKQRGAARLVDSLETQASSLFQRVCQTLDTDVSSALCACSVSPPSWSAIDGGYRRSIGRPAHGHPVRGACTAARGGKTESLVWCGASFVLFLFFSRREEVRVPKTQTGCVSARWLTASCPVTAITEVRLCRFPLFSVASIASPRRLVPSLRREMSVTFLSTVRRAGVARGSLLRSGISRNAVSNVALNWSGTKKQHHGQRPAVGRTPSITPPSEIMSDYSN